MGDSLLAFLWKDLKADPLRIPYLSFVGGHSLGASSGRVQLEFIVFWDIHKQESIKFGSRQTCKTFKRTVRLAG